MIDYHAVMIDETGCEFGASVSAPSRSEAEDLLREMYPESRCDQLESPEDRRAREQAMYDHIDRGGDWDDEGRPIFHFSPEDEEEDEEEGYVYDIDRGFVPPEDDEEEGYVYDIDRGFVPPDEEEL